MGSDSSSSGSKKSPAAADVNMIVKSGVIAALYVVLTLLANAFGLANYSVQVRFSEALTVLPCVCSAAIPGVTIGCLLSNIITGCALPDIIFGTLATLIGALGTYALRKHRRLSWVPPVVSNMLIIPFILRYAYGLTPLWLFFFTVGAGEVISCGILGLLLLKALDRTGAMRLVEDPAPEDR